MIFFFFFKVNSMKYWHPHLPFFGQHISVSTLVKINKINYKERKAISSEY